MPAHTALWLTAPLLVLALFAGTHQPTRAEIQRTAPTYRAAASLWIERDAVMKLPIKGAAWRQLQKYAARSTETPDLSDQNDGANTCVLAKALVFARTDERRSRDQVIAACEAVMGTEKGARTLALGRNLMAFVLAADLVGLPSELDARFRPWLRKLVREPFQGRSVISTHEDRPNNWGTHAGASRIAVAMYLGDDADLERAATVFRGWLGDYEAYHGFRFGDLAWQRHRERPVGINPKGAILEGHVVDGVLPDDQRRAGVFQWPPPHENYVYEGLQGALAQAVLLERAGYTPWEWSDRALLRAYEWLYQEADYPAEGDDRWQVHLVNHVYGTSFPVAARATPGKNVGFLAWTHGEHRKRPTGARVPR